VNDGCGIGVTTIAGDQPVIGGGVDACGPGPNPLIVCTGCGSTNVTVHFASVSSAAPAGQFCPFVAPVGGMMSVQPAVGYSRSTPLGLMLDWRTDTSRYGAFVSVVARQISTIGSGLGVSTGAGVGVGVG
jgi:hypothetical protein